VPKHDSSIELGLLTGELDKEAPNRFVHQDKHIGCSPSRAQRIIHPAYPQVFDDRESFDIRLWSEEDRAKWTKVYTEAWVKLQEAENPSWKEDK
jgi:hypothetical protein